MSMGGSKDWRSEWAPMGDVAYLNFAAHAAIPEIALGAVQASIEAKRRPHLVDDASFFHVTQNLRSSLAALIGAEPDDIALTSGAGAGLAVIAYAMRWSPGDEVVVTSGEFPTHFATWKPMEAREGIKLKLVSAHDQFLSADDLIGALNPQTRLVSISHVRFDDGSLLDVRRLADACHSNGTLLLLDISQSCGAILLDVASLGADFIVCAGYKYLLSPWGTGFLWISREQRGILRSSPYNWVSQDVETFDKLRLVNPGPAATASRWDAAETSSLYNFNLTVMEASARFVLQAGPGLVRDHTLHLIDRLFAGLPAGCALASPRPTTDRGPFGCITLATRDATEELYSALRASHVVVSLREGRIRFAPHLLNTEAEIDRALAVIHQHMEKPNV